MGISNSRNNGIIFLASLEISFKVSSNDKLTLLDSVFSSNSTLDVCNIPSPPVAPPDNRMPLLITSFRTVYKAQLSLDTSKVMDQMASLLVSWRNVPLSLRPYLFVLFTLLKNPNLSVILGIYIGIAYPKEEGCSISFITSCCSDFYYLQSLWIFS